MTSMEVSATTLLLVPHPDHAAALLAKGPCRARPPTMWRNVQTHEAVGEGEDQTFRPLDPPRVTWHVGDGMGGARDVALVLAYESVPTEFGTMRAARIAAPLLVDIKHPRLGTRPRGLLDMIEVSSPHSLRYIAHRYDVPALAAIPPAGLGAALGSWVLAILCEKAGLGSVVVIGGGA